MINGTRSEIEYLFRSAKFNLEQIEMIGHICRVLGKYMFVDRTILEARAGKKIGLSFILKCSKHNIITEMQYQNKSGLKDIFFYQLGMGGMNLLEKAKERFHTMNILADKEMKSRILTFNYFAAEKGYDISMKYQQEIKHRFFFCKKGVICYFPRVIKEMEIIRILISHFSEPQEEYIPTVEDIRGKFNSIPVGMDLLEIGLKTKNSYMKKGE